MSEPKPSKPKDQEASPEATLRLVAGAPVDPRSTQRLDISNIILKQKDAGRAPSPRPWPAATSDETLKLSRPKLDDPPLRIQRIDQPAEAAGQTLELPAEAEAPGRPTGWKRPLLLGGALVLVAAAYLVVSNRSMPPTSAGSSPGKPAPLTLDDFLKQAKAGDAYAMRMLGVMYYHGLNVPQDREKGLYWYRKAAEKSDVARAELATIEGGR